MPCESMRKTSAVIHFPGTLMRMTGGSVLIRADENISSRSQLSTWQAPSADRPPVKQTYNSGRIPIGTGSEALHYAAMKQLSRTIFRRLHRTILRRDESAFHAFEYLAVWLKPEVYGRETEIERNLLCGGASHLQERVRRESAAHHTVNTYRDMYLMILPNTHYMFRHSLVARAHVQMHRHRFNPRVHAHKGTFEELCARNDRTEGYVLKDAFESRILQSNLKNEAECFEKFLKGYEAILFKCQSSQVLYQFLASPELERTTRGLSFPGSREYRVARVRTPILAQSRDVTLFYLGSLLLFKLGSI
ncbi:hypothetical protein EAG_13840 [Camponotus floridanus]|uniref:Uncharacterized protein n=1 Tax=Camponotus floridanus TaxID=104421 RepID=E2AVK9_CAMFO|nr:hypothetical protein EAG_13840 [Camponotus floridanus]